MTLENCLTMVVILVLFIIALREWLYVLSHHPMFIATVIIFGIANALGPKFPEAITLVIQVIVGVFVAIFIAGFIIAIEKTLKEDKEDEAKK